MSDLVSCPACPDGYVWNSRGQTATPCPRCHGYAELHRDGRPLTRAEFENGLEADGVCPRCLGTGAIDTPTSNDDPICPNCDGEGVI